MGAKKIRDEIKYFSHLEHIWWGAKTTAGQRRYDNKFKLFKKTCKPTNTSKILEIGCGDGEFTKRLVKLTCRIIASDITPAVVKRGREYFGGKRKNLVFKLENAQKLSFKDNSFDIVCGISILHHINLSKALKEVFRVLKPKGQIFFTEPNLLNPHVFLGLNIPYFREKMEFSPDETALVRWRVEKILKKIGFNSIRVTNYDFLHPKTPHTMLRLVEKIGKILEKMPLIKEISGSLIIWAKK